MNPLTKLIILRTEFESLLAYYEVQMDEINSKEIDIEDTKSNVQQLIDDFSIEAISEYYVQDTIDLLEDITNDICDKRVDLETFTTELEELYTNRLDTLERLFKCFDKITKLEKDNKLKHDKKIVIPKELVKEYKKCINGKSK